MDEATMALDRGSSSTPLVWSRVLVLLLLCEVVESEARLGVIDRLDGSRSSMRMPLCVWVLESSFGRGRGGNAGFFSSEKGEIARELALLLCVVVVVDVRNVLDLLGTGGGLREIDELDEGDGEDLAAASCARLGVSGDVGDCVSGFRGITGGFRGNAGGSRSSRRSFCSAGLGAARLRIALGAGISGSCLPIVNLLLLLGGVEIGGLFCVCITPRGAAAGFSSRTGDRSAASRAAICCGVCGRAGSLTSLR